MSEIDHTAPCQSHSPTSREAAEQITSATHELRERIFEFVTSRGARGATDQEIASALGIVDNTERPRRVELCRDGRLTTLGQIRQTRSGRNAAVWVAAHPLFDFADKVHGLVGLMAEAVGRERPTGDVWQRVMDACKDVSAMLGQLRTFLGRDQRHADCR